jgi:hypothetical protein
MAKSPRFTSSWAKGPSETDVIPKRYLIATLFIAAMLVLLAVVQAPRSKSQGGVGMGEIPVALSLESFETLAEFRLADGWAPRFQGTRDPDQLDPWPYAGGFEAPWEPASPFLADQGFAMNGPTGRGEILLWRGLEWRRFRFEAPICSARLDPDKGHRLLVTLALGGDRFQTRLMEMPEGRVLWASDSGPWSRFSWDGKAVLLGLRAPAPEGAWLLTTLPVDGDALPQTLAPWDEPGLPPPPKGWITRADLLWDDGKDLLGPRLLTSLRPGARLWFPRADRLWLSGGGSWSLWGLEEGIWRRLGTGDGVLAAQPPLRMGRIRSDREDRPLRALSSLSTLDWKELPEEAEAWPDYDAAWAWKGENAALTAWDLRWGKGVEGFPRERQREGIVKAFRADWRAAASLRASVRGWLPEGPDIALREASEVAWVWVGDRILLVRLQGSERLRKIRNLLKAR